MKKKVDIVKVGNQEEGEKYYLAFKRNIRPSVGDLTIGINDVCKVVHIIDKVGFSEFILSDGSALINPVKLICPLSDVYVDCEGTEKNPSPFKDDGFISILVDNSL